jgi:hypothetical protein
VTVERQDLGWSPIEDASSQPGWHSSSLSQGPEIDAQGPEVDAQGPGIDAQGPGIDAQGPGIDAQGPGIDAPGLEIDWCHPGLSMIAVTLLPYLRRLARCGSQRNNPSLCLMALAAARAFAAACPGALRAPRAQRFMIVVIGRRQGGAGSSGSG